jgi:hypothetical protein
MSFRILRQEGIAMPRCESIGPLNDDCGENTQSENTESIKIVGWAKKQMMDNPKQVGVKGILRS